MKLRAIRTLNEAGTLGHKLMRVYQFKYSAIIFILHITISSRINTFSVVFTNCRGCGIY